MRWAPGEPNDHDNGEDCGALRSSADDYAYWNDFNCATEIKTICEKGTYKTILITHHLEMNNIPNSELVFSNTSGILHFAWGNWRCSIACVTQ